MKRVTQPQLPTLETTMPLEQWLAVMVPWWRERVLRGDFKKENAA